MEKENIKVYNLTVVELESRELSKSEAEIAMDDNFTDSIANITENANEKLESMCDEVKFGVRKNENGTIFKLAIKVTCRENITFTKLAFIKDLIGSVISIITSYINVVSKYKTELNYISKKMYPENLEEICPENETHESDSQLEETKEE